jgi:hypothetical protein
MLGVVVIVLSMVCLLGFRHIWLGETADLAAMRLHVVGRRHKRPGQKPSDYG